MGLWDFDLGGRSAAEIDESAGPIQPGYYRTKVESAAIKPEDGSVALKFRVCYGPMSGKSHTEYLKSPQMAGSDYAREVAVKKAVVYLRRLGIISPDHAGPISNPDWSKAVGKEVIIHVIHRKWDANPVKGLQAGERTEIDFAGVWPIDHRDVGAFKPEIRGALGLPGWSATPAPAAGAASVATVSGPTAPRATPAELAKSLWGE